VTAKADGGRSTPPSQDTSFAPIPVHRARQEVEQQLRRAIATGQLADGEKLPTEALLSEMFNVSRATVREALRSLDTSGLIKKVPGAGGGSFVRSMGSGELAELFADSLAVMLAMGTAVSSELVTIRSFLEVPSARLAAVHRSASDIADLREVLEEERRAAFDDARVAELDVQFHSSIAGATGNAILAALVGSLHTVMRPVAQMEITEEIGWRTVRQHREIIDAIERGDPDAAEIATRSHLEYLATVALQG
jgi:GntR family transcriptional repressor for pyruvate dehydrogenase complex